MLTILRAKQVDLVNVQRASFPFLHRCDRERWRIQLRYLRVLDQDVVVGEPLSKVGSSWW